MIKTIFEWLEEQGYHPQDKKLYLEACTHSSYANEANIPMIDNERLEFVGDAVLQIWSANALYHINPPMREGKMTTLRSQVVSENPLASVNRELGWYAFLKLGHGEEKMGGRLRNSLLADQFEAIMGAVYLDLGYEEAFRLLDQILYPLIEQRLAAYDEDYKTRLQHYCQADRSSIYYKILKEYGPSNEKTFVAGVYINDILLGKGVASSKKKAEQQAAREAFEKLA